MFDFFESMKRADENNDKRKRQIDKLMADVPKEMPKVGDKVIIASGLLGHGWDYIRREGIITEIADYTVKAKWENYPGHSTVDIREEWMHPAFIVDTLKPSKK